MRISWHMSLQTVRDVTGGSLCGRCVRTYRRDFLRVPPEYQTDTSPATLAVIQGEIAATIFHDLIDDREAEARPLAARGHIGQGEPLTGFPAFSTRSPSRCSGPSGRRPGRES